jgi:cell division initiation protein
VKITPLDIRRKEFKRAVRGYSDEEVDIFLDVVADEFERVFQENMELQDKVHGLEQQAAGLAQVREALEKTLITAQVQSEEMRSNAHKESELILRDAEFKARGIVNDSYGETQRVQQALVQLKILEEDFRFKFRSLLEGYLNLLGEAPIAAQAAETAALTRPVPVAESPAPVAESPAPVAEPPAAAEVRASVAAEVPQAVEEAPPTPVPDDEAPTEENEAVAARVRAAVDAYAAAEAQRAAAAAPDEEVTAESSSPVRADAPEVQPEVDSMNQGFFFGRQTDDFDDTFQGEDAIKTDKTRDFQW